MIIWIIWWLFADYFYWLFDTYCDYLIFEWLFAFDYLMIILIILWKLFDVYFDYLSFDYLWLFAFNYLTIILIICLLIIC